MLSDVLASRPYPGRACLAARTVDGQLSFTYVLTGRSTASRERGIVILEGGDVVVRDKSSAARHDALRHYVAAARRGEWTVVGNGEHVVPLAEQLESGAGAADAWAPHGYEPDSPIYTSRIWVARQSSGTDTCMIGRAQRSPRGDGGTDHLLLAIAHIPVGTGVLVTTYAGTAAEVRDGGHPVEVAFASSSPQELLRETWNALTPELRVAGFALLPDDEDGGSVVVSD